MRITVARRLSWRYPDPHYTALISSGFCDAFLTNALRLEIRHARQLAVSQFSRAVQQHENHTRVADIHRPGLDFRLVTDGTAP
jgi:hypothetical protein